VQAQPPPLLLGELHALPIVVARRILSTEPDAPRLRRRTFRGGDVSLKLDAVGAVVGRDIDEGVGEAETPVVCLGHLRDDDAHGGLRRACWRSDLGGHGQAAGRSTR
jgi:hypothetical protein